MAAKELFLTTLYNDANLQTYYRVESDFTATGPNGYTLTGGNTPTFGTGKFGNAAQFASASSQYAERASGTFANLIASGSQTWMCYVKLTTNAAAMEAFSYFNGGSVLLRMQLNSGANGRVQFQAVGLTTNDIVTASSNLSTGTWYHLAGVYDSSAGKLRVYVDGTLTEVTASGTVTAPSGTTPFDLGRLASSNTEYLNGDIDDFAMFNRALSTSEIQDYVNGATPLRTAGGAFLMNFM